MIATVSTSTKTLQLRIKDKHAKVLRQMAREVNQVWNHVNEVSAKAGAAFPRQAQISVGYDLQKCTAGYSKCDDVSVGSGTVQLVCVEYATRRKQFKKTRLNWRVSNPKSSKYSLGWIPFKGGHAKYKAGQIHFAGQKFSLWDSYGLSKYELRAGSFTEDSRGRWYFNVTIEMPEFIGPRLPAPAVGIDLGLKDCATIQTRKNCMGAGIVSMN
jgi:putative transposase